MTKKNDIVIGTKEEALWTKVKESREAAIKEHEDSLIVERAVLELANQKIEHEKNNNSSDDS